MATFSANEINATDRDDIPNFLTIKISAYHVQTNS